MIFFHEKKIKKIIFHKNSTKPNNIFIMGKNDEKMNVSLRNTSISYIFLKKMCKMTHISIGFNGYFFEKNVVLKKDHFLEKKSFLKKWKFGKKKSFFDFPKKKNDFFWNHHFSKLIFFQITIFKKWFFFRKMILKSFFAQAW